MSTQQLTKHVLKQLKEAEETGGDCCPSAFKTILELWNKNEQAVLLKLTLPANELEFLINSEADSSVDIIHWVVHKKSTGHIIDNCNNGNIDIPYEQYLNRVYPKPKKVEVWGDYVRLIKQRNLVMSLNKIDMKKEYDKIYDYMTLEYMHSLACHKAQHNVSIKEVTDFWVKCMKLSGNLRMPPDNLLNILLTNSKCRGFTPPDDLLLELIK